MKSYPSLPFAKWEALTEYPPAYCKSLPVPWSTAANQWTQSSHQFDQGGVLTSSQCVAVEMMIYFGCRVDRSSAAGALFAFDVESSFDSRQQPVFCFECQRRFGFLFACKWRRLICANSKASALSSPDRLFDAVGGPILRCGFGALTSRGQQSVAHGKVCHCRSIL